MVCFVTPFGEPAAGRQIIVCAWRRNGWGTRNKETSMAILPSRANVPQSIALLTALKKGDKQQRDDFIYTYHQPFYSIAYMATGNGDRASELTISAFQEAFHQLRQVNPKRMTASIWDWLLIFIVEACAAYHEQNSAPIPNAPRTDPSADGSANMDWETTIVLGAVRVKRCLSQLPLEQQKVFFLRHHFQLNYDQIGDVINEAPETVKAWLFRARVQIVKCLGRG